VKTYIVRQVVEFQWAMRAENAEEAERLALEAGWSSAEYSETRTYAEEVKE